MEAIRTIIWTAVAAAAFLAVLSVCITALIYKKMFGSRFTHDPLVKTYTPEMFDLTAKPFEVVLDGERIRGAVYSKKGADIDKTRLVIVCHGMWTSHMSYMQDIGYLCGEGLQVLSFDYIGVSRSDGKMIGGFGQSLRSLDAVIRYVKGNRALAGRKIIVYGHSWGGYAVTNIVKFHPDLAGVVAIAPATSFSAVIRKNFPKWLHYLIPIANLFDRLHTGRFANQNGVESLSDYRGQLLVLHSEDDHMCPYGDTVGLMKSSLKGDNFKFVTMTDKRHHPHYSYRALTVMKEYSSVLSTLTTEEERNAHKSNTDFIAMGELDSAVMDTIVRHIKGV